MLLPEGVINLCADTCRHHLRASYNPTRPASGSNRRENSAHGAANHVTSVRTAIPLCSVVVPEWGENSIILRRFIDFISSSSNSKELGFQEIRQPGEQAVNFFSGVVVNYSDAKDAA
jgi:hypothetical protein